MNRFSYLAEKINDAVFLDEPFLHIQIEDFFSKDDFASIINCPEIVMPKFSSDQQLLSALKSKGYRVINFPGCITKEADYIKWHINKAKSSRIHSACEGFGMVLRLYEKESQILEDLEEFLASDEFNSAIAKKFDINLSACKIDGGIQKYLDGYEISPHPDIRKKAATYMVNINPIKASEDKDYHTHYLKFISSKKYVYDFWENNSEYDRDWVPWDWCDTFKQQRKNNSIVIFSPSNDTIHAVKANYDHLITQRTQLYGNIWHKESKTLPLKWEQLQIPHDNELTSLNLLKNFNVILPSGVKKLIKKALLKESSSIGKTNMD